MFSNIYWLKYYYLRQWITRYNESPTIRCWYVISDCHFNTHQKMNDCFQDLMFFQWKPPIYRHWAVFASIEGSNQPEVNSTAEETNAGRSVSQKAKQRQLQSSQPVFSVSPFQRHRDPSLSQTPFLTQPFHWVKNVPSCFWIGRV